MDLNFYMSFALLAGEYMYLGLLYSLLGILKSRAVASALARIPSVIILNYLYELNPSSWFRLIIDWIAVILLTEMIKRCMDDAKK